MPRAAARDLRDDIVRSAMRLLQKHGAHGFSQPQVAKEVGVEQGHLTYYFPRRSDLLGAVAQRYSAETAAEIEALVDAKDPKATLERGLLLVRRLAHDRARTRMWLGLLVEADNDPNLRAALVENTTFVRTSLSRILGRTPEDPAVELALYSLWGIGIAHLLHRGRSAGAHTDELVTAVATSLAPKARRS